MTMPPLNCASLSRNRASMRGRGRARSASSLRGRSYVPEDDPKDARAAKAWNEVYVVINTRDEERGIVPCIASSMLMYRVEKRTEDHSAACCHVVERDNAAQSLRQE